jgi:hypothetical protein
VTIETAGAEVTAHRLVLSAVSPMLKAALSGRWGEPSRVRASSSSAEAVSLLLDLAYSGTSARDFDHKLALEALDLAHEWQCDSIVLMLEGALVPLITNASFEAIALAAAVKELVPLREACARYAKISDEVGVNLDNKKYGAAVQDMLRPPKKGAEQPAKRPRRSF